MTTAVNFHRTRRLSIKNYRDEGLEPENSASSSECIIIIGACGLAASLAHQDPRARQPNQSVDDTKAEVFVLCIARN